MLKVLKITGWIVFTLGVLVLTAIANATYSKIATTAPVIRIDRSQQVDFVSNEIILEKLNDLGYSFNNQTLKDIELDRIENQILSIPGVKSVEAYKFLDGRVEIDITQRRPIARVVKSDGMIGFYLDEEGEIIPLSDFYVAKVSVFNGAIDDNLSKGNVLNFSEKQKEKYLLDDIYKVALSIDQNEFMKAQILQIYVTPQKEFEMIPRLGNQRVLFGKSDDAKLKINKLEKFYTEGIVPEELNMYDTLNVKYYNQIICSKR